MYTHIRTYWAEIFKNTHETVVPDHKTLKKPESTIIMLLLLCSYFLQVWNQIWKGGNRVRKGIGSMHYKAKESLLPPAVKNLQFGRTKEGFAWIQNLLCKIWITAWLAILELHIKNGRMLLFLALSACPEESGYSLVCRNLVWSCHGLHGYESGTLSPALFGINSII